jgi:hypothetical protein
MIALLIGTVIALAAVAFVLVPLFRDERTASPVETSSGAGPDGGTSDDAVGALREIEFDRATGKLSDADYAALKSRYTAEALEAMRAADASPRRPTSPNRRSCAIGSGGSRARRAVRARSPMHCIARRAVAFFQSDAPGVERR